MSNIVTIVQNSGVELKRAGRYYIGRCPFHNDKTPSFVVYPDSNSWYCFGNCSTNGGDAIAYVMRRYNYSFPQAKEFVEGNFSFNIKFKPPKPQENKIVPHGMVIYWHSMLQEHRSYFHSRGFTDKTIDQEMFGWDGQRYVIPVWEGEPGNSSCLGVRKRKANGQGPKYIGLKGSNHPTVWGRWHCRDQRLVFAFAGELDACLAVQDKFPSFSIVGGIQSIEQFPDTWPQLWFPGCFECIVIFDRKEESFGGRLASAWNRVKGFGSATVFHWDPNLDIKDYCEFRQKYPIEKFKENLYSQSRILI